MEPIQYIVETLNRSPFNKTLSLVEFSSLSAQELLQVLNDIVCVLDVKNNTRDIRDETPDVTATRLIDLVVVLNYKHNMDLVNFRDHLMAGDVQVLYPLMKWLLERMSELKKRLYVARFLRNLDVPEEFFTDEVLVHYYEQYKSLQLTFKDVHKRVEKIRESRTNPGELRNEIAQLETEREQLLTKMSKLQDRVDKDTAYGQQSNFNELLDGVRKFRKEQEEESRLVNLYEEQRKQFFESEQKYKLMDAKLSALQSLRASGDPIKIVEQLRAQVNELEVRAKSELPEQIDERKRTLEELQEMILDHPMSESEMYAMENEFRQLQDEVASLTQKRDQMQSSVDERVGFYRDRVTGVERKRDAVADELQERKRERQESELDLRRLENEMSVLTNGGKRPMTDAQVKEYMVQLQEKTVKYQECKQELQELQSELSVLIRTEEILRSRDKHIEEFNEQHEREHGVEGAMQAQRTLEEVSAAKSDIDKSKGDLLDEMAQMVADIRAKVKEKKTKLQPMIVELRNMRESYKHVERAYLEKKRASDSVLYGVESEKNRVESELAELKNSLRSEESVYHRLHSLCDIERCRVELVREEDRRIAANQHPTHLEQVEAQISEYENETKKLRKRQHAMKGSVESRAQQRQLFKNLENLLTAKVHAQQSAIQAQQQAVQEHRENYARYADPNAGVDRLVFD